MRWFDAESSLSVAERPEPYLLLSCEEAAYLAGIIDGEGTIGIYDLEANGFSYHLRLVIGNTSLELIDWVHERVHGSVRTVIPKDPRWKVGYQLVAVQGTAAAAIRRCLPYLVVKKEQARLGLEFIDGFVSHRGKPVSEAERARRKALADRISSLNSAPGVGGVVRKMGRPRKRC